MKFYKITNEEERHNGMQYQDGLNVDVVKFKPHGSCLSGGIYYSREDILAFLWCGVWLREVTIPEDARTYEDPDSDAKKWKSDKVILGPRRKITLDVIKELVAEGADIHVDDDSPLRSASICGNLELVKYLIEQGADENLILHCDKYGEK